jgi:hypothetical protein
MPDPMVDPKELAEVQQEYLYRYFRSFPPHAMAGQHQQDVYSSAMTGMHSSVEYQPVTKRVRLPA